MRIIDSWFGGSSGLRRIEYRVCFDDGKRDYCLEYKIEGVCDWVIVEDGMSHRVAKGFMVMVVREDLRKGLKERRLA